MKTEEEKDIRGDSNSKDVNDDIKDANGDVEDTNDIENTDDVDDMSDIENLNDVEDVKKGKDIILIRRIQRRGDPGAADMLVRKYYDEILCFVGRQTVNEITALDLTQEIFISMLKTLKYYHPKKGAGFRTWLYRIAANKIVDYFRSRAALSRETLSLDDVEPVDKKDFILGIENREFAAKVCDYVNTLSADTQKIFRLHIWGQYTFAEIAESMHVPESSVKSKYYRLLHTLRREFGGWE